MATLDISCPSSKITQTTAEATLTVSGFVNSNTGWDARSGILSYSDKNGTKTTKTETVGENITRTITTQYYTRTFTQTWTKRTYDTAFVYEWTDGGTGNPRTKTYTGLESGAAVSLSIPGVTAYAVQRDYSKTYETSKQGSVATAVDTDKDGKTSPAEGYPKYSTPSAPSWSAPTSWPTPTETKVSLGSIDSSSKTIYTQGTPFSYNASQNASIATVLTVSQVNAWCSACQKYRRWQAQNSNFSTFPECYASADTPITATWYNRCVEAKTGTTGNAVAGSTIITAALINALNISYPS